MVVGSVSRGCQVVVIGAGPGGLSAAYYLRRKGHAVTVFESQAMAGGMLRYGIPEYRLPKQALDSEIAAVRELGAHFRLGESCAAFPRCG